MAILSDPGKKIKNDQINGYSGDPYTTGTAITTASTTDTEVPSGWPQKIVYAPAGGPPGAPIQYGDTITNETADAGFGYIGTGAMEETQRYFFHSDHLGSTSYVTDASGNINQYVAYLPFGETFIEGHSDWDCPYKFNAKEYDSETGLYYYGARYYDAKISRFVSFDPLAEKFPKLTPYQFAGNKPIIAVDLDGLEPAYIQNGRLIETSDEVHRQTGMTNGHPGFMPKPLQQAIKTAEAKNYQKSVALKKALNPGTIRPAKSNYEKNWEATNPEWSRDWIKTDPVIKSTAVAGAVTMAAPLFSTGISVKSIAGATADFGAQLYSNYLGNGNLSLSNINWTSVGTNAVFTNPFTAAGMGSAFQYSLDNGFYNSLLGNKTASQFGTETLVGGVGNYLGDTFTNLSLTKSSDSFEQALSSFTINMITNTGANATQKAVDNQE
jgi:RHS repeat-associated protein